MCVHLRCRLGITMQEENYIATTHPGENENAMECKELEDYVLQLHLTREICQAVNSTD